MDREDIINLFIVANVALPSRSGMVDIFSDPRPF
jgi:hypothetical protein